jgi:hypothetical protein
MEVFATLCLRPTATTSPVGLLEKKIPARLAEAPAAKLGNVAFCWSKHFPHQINAQSQGVGVLR